jgi:uncharacterized membrane protein YidH (DUF202 family)
MTRNRSTDGTRELLQWGSATLAAGLISAVAAKCFLGGIDTFGAHSNGGWFALIVALMCLPFGLMLTVLGAAKWLRNRRHQRGQAQE